MEIIDTALDAIKIIRTNVIEDTRGSFQKLYHKNQFKNFGIYENFDEKYISVSRKNVIRGMHFQTPPNDHSKIVSCINGTALDVALDIRKDSSTYGQFFSVEISKENGLMVYIPKGFAHGFIAKTDDCALLYQVSSVHSPKSDKGILWSSFGYDWGILKPLLSERDKSFLPFSSFKSPFRINI